MTAAPALEIRAYRPEDRADVVRLHEELQTYERAFRATRAVGGEVSEWQVREYEDMMAKEDARLLIAARGGAAVGYAFFLAEREELEAEPGQIYVQDFMVTASARRAGVGSALMAAVRAFGDEHGLGRIDLQVLVGNDAALAFHRAQGFDTSYLGLKAVLAAR